MEPEKAEDNNVYFDRMVKEIAEGHSDSLSELYDTLRKPVFVLALSILQDYYVAEDVMQETFIRVATYASEKSMLRRTLPAMITPAIRTTAAIVSFIPRAFNLTPWG
jgi:hypothetical protein